MSFDDTDPSTLTQSVPPFEGPEPPADYENIAAAQAAREASARRTQRNFLRNDKRAPGDTAPNRQIPASATELNPIKVTSDEEYNAVAPGAYFIAPDGSKRKKPWYVTDDATYDAVPENEFFIDPEGKRRQKPKYDNLPFGAQYFLNNAVNDKERVKVLEHYFPGRVKANARGELYVENEDGTRLRGKGFADAPGALIAEQAPPAIGGLIGEYAGARAGHAIVPYVGGMVGGIIGGGAGAAAGQVFNDIVMRSAGFYDRSQEEAYGKIGTVGTFGSAGSAIGRVLLPMAPNMAAYLKTAAPNALGKFLGMEVGPTKMALQLSDQGVLPPPSAHMFDAPHVFNLSEVIHPALQTKGGGPYIESATKHVEKGSSQILRSLGIEDAESVVTPKAAVATEEAGLALQARAQAQRATVLEATEADLAEKLAAVRARATTEAGGDVAAQQEAAVALAANRAAAQDMINSGYEDLARTANAALEAAGADMNSGSLWKQFAEKLQELKQAVVQRHRKWYSQVDEIAGHEPMDVSDLAESASQFLTRLPTEFESQYPHIVKKIRDLVGVRNTDKNGNIIDGWKIEPAEPTFSQLHELRSQLRNEVDWYRLPSSLTEGPYRLFSGKVDEVLHSGTSPNHMLASQMLDATDRSYGANIANFNDGKLAAILRGIRSGMPADPIELFQGVVQEGRSELTRWVRDQVGPTLWAAVRNADIADMLHMSKSTALDGTIDGSRFVAEVVKRDRHNMLEVVHGPDAAKLIRQAQNIQRLEGKLDIPAREGDTFSELVNRIKLAQQATDEAAKRSPLDTLEKEIRTITLEHRRAASKANNADPLNFLADPSYGAQKAVERILSSEDLVIEAAKRFGEKSPEFNMLRQVYAEKLLRKSLNPRESLEGVSKQVQELMFPGLSGQHLQILADEMAFIWGSKAARTQTGASIMANTAVEHPGGKLPWGSTIMRELGSVPFIGVTLRTMLASYVKAITWAATNPTLFRFVLRGLESANEAERFTARNMLKAMAFGPGANRGGAIGAGVGGAVAANPGDPQREVDPAILQALGVGR